MPPSETMQDIMNTQTPEELLHPWRKIIAEKKSKELVELLKNCAKHVCSTSVFRNLLNFMDIDEANSSFNERFEELAGYLYIFLVDEKNGRKVPIPWQNCNADEESRELNELLEDCAQSLCWSKDFRKILDLMGIDVDPSNRMLLHLGCNLSEWLHIFLIHLRKRQEFLRPWQEFIADGNSKELLALLKSCAKGILKKSESRDILDLIDVDIENADKDDSEKLILDISAYIYIYLNDRLKNCPHFAEMFHRGDFSRIVLELKGKIHQKIADESRSGTTDRAYYRRCRESLSKSDAMHCTTIYDSSGKKKVGTRFAPALEPDVQQAEKLFFDFDEYPQLPAPPYLLQRDIRKSEQIVPAALFFWHQAAERKGRYAFHLQEFVNYMAAHYDIHIANAPVGTRLITQIHNPDDDKTCSIDQTHEDPQSEDSLDKCELAKILLEKLSPLELAILQARKEGLSRRATEKKLGISEHTYKKSLIKIQSIAKPFRQS